eukprot:6205260-Pleurochrysis_carterae.AAC.1
MFVNTYHDSSRIDYAPVTSLVNFSSASRHRADLSPPHGHPARHTRSARRVPRSARWSPTQPRLRAP